MKKGHTDRSRRDFLIKGAAGLAGAASLAGASILPSMLRAEEKEPSKKDRSKFVYRTLGKTGIRLPIVSVGAAASDAGIFNAAFEAGLIHFDTANTYMNGQHESIIGQVVAGKPRDSFIITTKIYQPYDQRTGQYRSSVTEQTFTDAFDQSLKRLGLDYVDILQMHDVVCREAVVYEPILNALEKLKKAGKTRFVGVSAHTNEPEVINAAVDSKFHDVVLTSYNFRQPHYSEVKKAIARAAKAGLGIIAMKTMAGVYWDRERTDPINVKAALKWVLSDENVHTAIPGFTTFDQMNDDISVMADLKLTAEEKKDLKLGMAPAGEGLYCSQCRRCVGECRNGHEIPALMRSYMYAYGYRDLAKAKATASPALEPGIRCAECSSCTVRCRMGYDVKSRVMDIARIGNVPDDFIA